ncbi:hypothetical protein [Enterobacter hormaechei]|nr:hypothetical protein [Enterobacter hormaechei]
MGAKKFRMLATLTLKLLKLTHGISDMKNIFSRDSSLGQ